MQYFFLLSMKVQSIYQYCSDNSDHKTFWCNVIRITGLLVSFHKISISFHHIWRKKLTFFQEELKGELKIWEQNMICQSCLWYLLEIWVLVKLRQQSLVKFFMSPLLKLFWAKLSDLVQEYNQLIRKTNNACSNHGHTRDALG